MVVNYNKNINLDINTYENNDGNKNIKLYKFCFKCGVTFHTPSPSPFCDNDNFCRNEYYSENAREIDSVWREIGGID